MKEILFAIEESSEGGFTAKALNESIFTEAEILEQLRLNVKEAVECHFGENEMPGLIRLQLP
jgi:hypothetical protein